MNNLRLFPAGRIFFTVVKIKKILLVSKTTIAISAFLLLLLVETRRYKVFAPGYDYKGLTTSQYKLLLLDNSTDKDWIIENTESTTLFNFQFYPTLFIVLAIIILSILLILFSYYQLARYKKKAKRTKIEYADLLLNYLCLKHFSTYFSLEKISLELSSNRSSNLMVLHSLIEKLTVDQYVLKLEDNKYMLTMKGAIFFKTGGYMQVVKDRQRLIRLQELRYWGGFVLLALAVVITIAITLYISANIKSKKSIKAKSEYILK